MRWFIAILLAGPLFAPLDPARGEQETRSREVGVVSQIRVVSDKVPDVTTLEAWKKSFIKEGMTDEEKAMAIWRTVSMFQHQDSSVEELLHNEGSLTDVMKVIHVYGHSYCGMAAAHAMSLARYIGMEARGWTINSHVVPEIKWDGAWHLLDPSLLVYFPKADKKIASVEEVIAAVKEWYARNPEYWDGKKGDEGKLRKLHQEGGWQGWRKGPELLNNCPTYDPTGWVPAKSHGWYAQMMEYDGSCGDGKPFLYEMGFSQGYQVNVQLRKGEKLVRNWGHKGLHLENKPGCLNLKPTEGGLAYSSKMFGDLSNGRIGNGTHEYTVPVTTGAYRKGALLVENLADQSAQVKDAAKDGVLVIRMPSSYVYLSGQVALQSVIPTKGEIHVLLSDNNGLDWKTIHMGDASGSATIDLKPHVYRRYDYRLKFLLKGQGVGLSSLKISHDIQHSQRPLPALGQGENTITFGSGVEGTISVEGSHYAAHKGKQVLITDFKPAAEGMSLMDSIAVKGPKGEVVFPVETPGDITRVRFGLSGRVNDKTDRWALDVSWDNGKTWQAADTLTGPARFASKFATATGAPAGTRKVLVRYSGQQTTVAMIFNLRIDVDYREPQGGFAPVKITYAWDEAGQEKQHVHVARKADEVYKVTCAGRPTMKSITLELAE
jgi:hypothetical protein